MKKALINVHIGDIHFGAFDSSVLYDELNSEFLKVIKKLPRIDILTINGDLFDHELSMNSNHAFYVLKFLDKLFKISRNKKCDYIRIIKGTKSHDHYQLDSLILPDDLDIKIINKASMEILYNDFKILYLPEEYIKDFDNYYNELFSDNYDMILGHGMLEEVSFNNFNSEISMESAPVFNTGELINICNGPIIFGHNHNGVCIKKQAFYTGSFSCWCQGEEHPKGFLISIINKKYTNNFKIIPYANKLSRKFITRNLSKIIKENNTENCIEYINKLIKKLDIYQLRIKVTEDNNDSEYMGRIASIQQFYNMSKNVKLNIESTSILDDEESEEIEISDRYSYLFEDGITEEKKISKYAYDKFGYNVSAERVNQLITQDVLKLIDEMVETEED